MDLPVYKLTINPDDPNTGVEFVALVDIPAIQRNWMAFAEPKQLFQVTQEDKHIVSGPLMIADMPIYRRELDGFEYYAMFDAPTIWQIAQKYFKDGRTSAVNLMHQPNEKVAGCYMFESFLIDKARGINTPTGFDTMPDGSWFGSFKIDNEAVWSDIKAGIFKGFSVEGFFDMSKAAKEGKMISQVVEILKQVEL